MAARYFELTSDKSSKFWEISVSGKSVTVRYGRIGSSGTKKETTYPASAAAKRVAEKLITEKEKKGYSEGAAKKATKAKLKKTSTKPGLQPVKKVKAPVPIAKSWERLHAFFKSEAPDYYKALNRPAKVSDIKRLEDSIGCELPADLKGSLRIHDGQDDWSYGVVYGLPLMSVDVIQRSLLAEMNFDQNANANVYPSFPLRCVHPLEWHCGWIPLASDSGGNYLGVDLVPDVRGTTGQVIVFGRDERIHPVLANSWAQFLCDLADELEDGNFQFHIEDEDEPPIFQLPQQPDHFHDAALDWSIAKMGIGKLSKAESQLVKKFAQR